MTISNAVAALTVVLAVACWWVLPHADFADYRQFAGGARP